MKEKESSLGICQRLFNLITNMLSGRGFMRIPLKHHPENDDSSGNRVQLQLLDVSDSGQVGIEFIQAEDFERWDTYGKANHEGAAEKRQVSSRASAEFEELKWKASDINEEAEAFIRRRREEMRRVFDMDQKLRANSFGFNAA